MCWSMQDCMVVQQSGSGNGITASAGVMVKWQEAAVSGRILLSASVIATAINIVVSGRFRGFPPVSVAVAAEPSVRQISTCGCWRRR